MAVKSAGRHVGVLRLDFQRVATPITSPRFNGAEQQRPDARRAGLRTHADVPQDGEIAASFEHADTGRVEGDDGASHTSAGIVGGKSPQFVTSKRLAHLVGPSPLMAS